MFKQTSYFIYACLLIAFSLFSCKSEQKPTQLDIVRENVEKHIKPKMNDPESYEFADLKLIDSITYLDNINYRKEYFQKQLQYNMDLLEVNAPYEKEFPKIWEESKKEEAEEYKNEIEKNKQIISAIEKIETELADKTNNVASYTYLYSFRGNNKMGAKVLNEYILQTDPAPDFKVLNLAENQDKVFLNPNDFPGYKEMIMKFMK